MPYKKRYSKHITSNPVLQHFALKRVLLRYLRIPAEWSVEEVPDAWLPVRHGVPGSPYSEKLQGWPYADNAPTDEVQDRRYALIPKVDQSANRQLFQPNEQAAKSLPIQLDPFQLRTLFLKLDLDNQSDTLDFLKFVGVWNINKQTGAGADSMRINCPVGHRLILGYASPFSLFDLKQAQKRVRSQMEWLEKDVDVLHGRFGPVPSASASNERRLQYAARNYHLNTLKLHFEWQNKGPAGVIEVVTGHEMLNATLHMNLMTGAKVQRCERCRVRFTPDHQRRYCDDFCMRAAATQAWRDKRDEEKAKEKGWRTKV